MPNQPSQPNQITGNRRQFLKSSSLTIAGSTLASQVAMAAPSVHPTGNDLLRVGLIGCGGRGTGAATQALTADENVKLTAMGDMFQPRLESSLRSLKQRKEIANKIDVPEDRQFLGFDAYQQVIDSGVDVVLLATPPQFRPMHLKAAIDADKHVFAEKPVAVDTPGVLSVLETCAEAKKKRLSLVSGLCLRFDQGFQETVQRLHEGQAGEIHTVMANDYRGPIWVKPRQPGWTDMHWQMHNWYYFTWLSGDFNVEQHVHYLDIAAWILQGYPVKAIGMGGRQVRTDEVYGNIYDHHSVIYEYENGARIISSCRQQPGCKNEMGVVAQGTNGLSKLSHKETSIYGKNAWSFEGTAKNCYQVEHDELFAGIRNDQPLNNGQYMAQSTLLAIMGRMATYTGQEITWEQALTSKQDLSPKQYAWGDAPPIEIAQPGITKLT